MGYGVASEPKKHGYACINNECTLIEDVVSLQSDCGTCPELTLIPLSTNRIFADTYGAYSLQSPGFPPLAYNLNACANYFYFIKALTEHCKDNLKNYEGYSNPDPTPAHLFQLNGGNLPNQKSNWPMLFQPEDVVYSNKGDDTYPYKETNPLGVLGVPDIGSYFISSGEGSPASGLTLRQIRDIVWWPEFSIAKGPPTDGTVYWYKSHAVQTEEAGDKVGTEHIIQLSDGDLSGYNWEQTTTLAMLKTPDALSGFEAYITGASPAEPVPFYAIPEWAIETPSSVYSGGANIVSSITSAFAGNKLSVITTTVDGATKNKLVGYWNQPFWLGLITATTGWPETATSEVKKKVGSNVFGPLTANTADTTQAVPCVLPLHPTSLTTTNVASSQFSTYIFGDPDVSERDDVSDKLRDASGKQVQKGQFYTDFPHTPIPLATYLYDAQYNKDHSGADIDTQLATAFNASGPNQTLLSNMWKWGENKHTLLRNCNIASVNWGSNLAYTIAPYSLTATGQPRLTGGPDQIRTIYQQSAYGASWKLYEWTQEHNKNGTNDPVWHGGFADSGMVSMDKAMKANPSTSLATYSFLEGSKVVESYNPNPPDPLRQDTKVTMLCSAVRDNNAMGLGHGLQHPYVALYLWPGSGGNQTIPGVGTYNSLFWKGVGSHFKYQLYYLAQTCLIMEDDMATWNASNKERKRTIAGEICLNPDIANGFAQQLGVEKGSTASASWDALMGSWTDPSSSAKQYLQKASNIPSTETDSWYYQKREGKPPQMVTDLMEVCTKIKEVQNPGTKEPTPSWVETMDTFLGKYDKPTSADPDVATLWNALSGEICGFRSMHAMVGIITNMCGPNVKVGQDIGWTFNPIGSGKWAHHTVNAAGTNPSTTVSAFDWETISEKTKIKPKPSAGNSAAWKDWWQQKPEPYDNSEYSKLSSAGLAVFNPIAPALYYLQNVVFGINAVIKIPAPVYKAVPAPGGGGGTVPSVQCTGCDGGYGDYCSLANPPICFCSKILSTGVNAGKKQCWGVGETGACPTTTTACTSE